jgi:hypothetical protein
MRHLEALGATEDVAAGQAVIVTARWLLVAAGLLLALVAPPSAATLRWEVVLILALAVCNFGLHAQVLRRRPAAGPVAYLASAADVAIITALVATDGGAASGLYVFYFPAIFVVAVAFPLAAAAAYAAATVGVYLAVCALTLPAASSRDLVVRGVALAGVAVCGAVYARIEARRRSGGLGARPDAAAEVA